MPGRKGGNKSRAGNWLKPEDMDRFPPLPGQPPSQPVVAVGKAHHSNANSAMPNGRRQMYRDILKAPLHHANQQPMMQLQKQRWHNIHNVQHPHAPPAYHNNRQQLQHHSPKQRIVEPQWPTYAEAVRDHRLVQFNAAVKNLWDIISNGEEWDFAKYSWHYDLSRDQGISYARETPSADVRWADVSCRLPESTDLSSLQHVWEEQSKHVLFPDTDSLPNVMSNTERPPKKTCVHGGLFLCVKAFKLYPERGSNSPLKPSITKCMWVAYDKGSGNPMRVLAGACISTQLPPKKPNGHWQQQAPPPREHMQKMVAMPSTNDCKFPFMVVVNSAQPTRVHVIGMKQFLENQERTNRFNPLGTENITRRGMGQGFYDNSAPVMHLKMYLTIAKNSGSTDFANVQSWELMGNFGSTLVAYRVMLKNGTANLVLGRSLVYPDNKPLGLKQALPSPEPEGTAAANGVRFHDVTDRVFGGISGAHSGCAGELLSTGASLWSEDSEDEYYDEDYHHGDSFNVCTGSSGAQEMQALNYNHGDSFNVCTGSSWPQEMQALNYNHGDSFNVCTGSSGAQEMQALNYNHGDSFNVCTGNSGDHVMQQISQQQQGHQSTADGKVSGSGGRGGSSSSSSSLSWFRPVMRGD